MHDAKKLLTYVNDCDRIDWLESQAAYLEDFIELFDERIEKENWYIAKEQLVKIRNTLNKVRIEMQLSAAKLQQSTLEYEYELATEE